MSDVVDLRALCLLGSEDERCFLLPSCAAAEFGCEVEIVKLILS